MSQQLEKNQLKELAEQKSLLKIQHTDTSSASILSLGGASFRKASLLFGCKRSGLNVYNSEISSDVKCRSICCSSMTRNASDCFTTWKKRTFVCGKRAITELSRVFGHCNVRVDLFMETEPQVNYWDTVISPPFFLARRELQLKPLVITSPRPLTIDIPRNGVFFKQHF